MKKTLRFLAAASVLTAAIGCQPADSPDVSTDIPVEMGESNVTAIGETPDSSVTGEAETPAVEVPAAPAEAEPAAVEAPAEEPAAPAEEPAAPAVDPADAPAVEEKPAD
jgi:hypothetical protein